MPENNTNKENIRILVVYHSQGGHTEKMAKTVTKGAESIGNCTVTLKKAGDATTDNLLNCDGLAIGSPEYFGYMAGMIKDFFDRVYEESKEKKELFKKPYVYFISAGNDGTGAAAHIERICRGFTLKKVSEPVIATGKITAEILNKCRELGQLLSAGCEAGVF